MTSEGTPSSRSAPKTDTGLNSRSVLFGRNTRSSQRPAIQFDQIRIGKPKQLYDEMPADLLPMRRSPIYTKLSVLSPTHQLDGSNIEEKKEMVDSHTHLYGDLPMLPEPLRHGLEKLTDTAAELDRNYRSAMESGRLTDHAVDLTVLKHRMIDDLQALSRICNAADEPLRLRAVVRQFLKGMAERIDKLNRG